MFSTPHVTFTLLSCRKMRYQIININKPNTDVSSNAEGHDFCFIALRSLFVNLSSYQPTSPILAT